MKLAGFMCFTPVYEYNGWTFEFGYSAGPWPVRRDGELYKRCSNKFYNDIDGFLKMPQEERNKYRVGGGCDPLVREE
jgi:hypothetical protein